MSHFHKFMVMMMEIYMLQPFKHIAESFRGTQTKNTIKR